MALYSIKAVYTYFKMFEPSNSTMKVLHPKLSNTNDANFSVRTLKRNVRTSVKSRRDSEEILPLKRSLLAEPMKRSWFIPPVKDNTHHRNSCDFMSQCVPEGVRTSLYQDSFQGLASKCQVQSAKNYFTTTCAAGVMVPDPKLVSFHASKEERFQKECDKLSQKFQTKYGQLIAQRQERFKNQFDNDTDSKPMTRFGMTRRRLSLE